MSKSKPEVLSDAYVKQWSIACNIASIAALIPVVIIGGLYATKTIHIRHLHDHVGTIVLLVAISVMFDIRRALLLENQAIHKALKGGGKA
jgi:hypothetical protein